jgi:hypothetical protein
MNLFPFFSFYLNHKQFFAATNITKRNTMHKYTRSILGNPSQQGNKNQPILFYILQEIYLHDQENISHRVLTNPRRLAPKRGLDFSQVDVLVEISKLTQKIYFLNGEFTFTYNRINLSTKVSIGKTGPTSLSQNIININQVNYLLH